MDRSCYGRATGLVLPEHSCDVPRPVGWPSHHLAQAETRPNNQDGFVPQSHGGILKRRASFVFRAALVPALFAVPAGAQESLLADIPQVTTVDAVSSVLSSVAECIIGCAENPEPDYDTCVANCWASEAYRAIDILSVLATRDRLTEIDASLLEQTLDRIVEIERQRATVAGIRQTCTLLRELFEEDWGDGDLRQVIDIYFLVTSNWLARPCYSGQAPEYENEVIDMLSAVAWNEDAMLQASHVGRCGVLATLPEDFEGLQILMDDYGITQADLVIGNILDAWIEVLAGAFTAERCTICETSEDREISPNDSMAE